MPRGTEVDFRWLKADGADFAFDMINRNIFLSILELGLSSAVTFRTESTFDVRDSVLMSNNVMTHSLH